MPRAFLITSRRYNGTGEFEETGREYSPEHGVRLAEYSCAAGQQPTSDGASECASEESSSSCPEELYNLTKLAEVSLAAAAGTLVHPRQHEPTRLFLERVESERESLIELKTRAEREDGPQEPPRIAAGVRYASELSAEFKLEQPHPAGLSPASGPTPVAQPSKSNAGLSQSQQPIRNDPQESVEEHECPDCGKRYSTSSNLARHRQTHRSLGDKKARRCPHCDKVYVSIPAFSMHVRTHNQGCKCHYCGKCFSRPWLLQGHIRTHTGEKPFKCTICNKAFADKSNLRAHVQTHSNTKPHVCARCGKAFALKSYLYKHEESSCMRAHQQQKRESSSSPRPSSQSSSSPASPQQLTASPTSVIVPPRSLASFSSVVPRTASLAEHESAIRRDEPGNELLSRMAIRTSVISPNPEHLARFAERKSAQQKTQQTTQPFDFNDPARVSAFSRPQPMTLNLAIA